jgi:uncharacterized membrane protein YGL010W
MNGYFRKQLQCYAEVHRDERNCVTHGFGIPAIFLAVILPLSMWPLTIFGVPVNAAVLGVIPAAAAWLLLDFLIGMAVVGIAVIFLVIAAFIVSLVSPAIVWLMAAALFGVGWAFQLIGHAYFEHRRPAFMDNPAHMLIGPMFMVAKLYIALGLRHDLLGAVSAESANPPSNIDNGIHQRP